MSAPGKGTRGCILWHKELESLALYCEGGASALVAGKSATAVLDTEFWSTTLVVGHSAVTSASRFVKAKETRTMSQLWGLAGGRGGSQKKGLTEVRRGLSARTLLSAYHIP